MRGQGLLMACLVAGLIALATSEDKPELKIEKVKEVSDCKRRSKSGDQLTMHYTGTLEDGTEFDSSREQEEPFVFQLGMGEVIKGWDEGLLDMCEGEKRKLTIPAHLGYGDEGSGDKIPGGATLLFDVEMIKVEDGPPPANVFKDIDANGDKHLSQEEVSNFIREQEKLAGMEQSDDTSHNEMVADIFRNEDQNKDGLISHDEFSGPKHDEL